MSAGGRMGELKHQYSDSVKLKWVDDGKESDWMKLHSLDEEPVRA